MRYFYTILFYLLIPFVFLRLLWRSRRQPAYRLRWGERLGWYPFRLDRCLWLHAVSVGEVIAATPLINQLRVMYPTLPLLVTTMTPTGSARVQSTLGRNVYHVYLPYDIPTAIRRFLAAMKPIAGIMMETELWPNLINICHQKKIPICLMNARLSEKSMRGYQWASGLVKETLLSLDMIGANGEADAKRFAALGMPVDRIHVTGNIKFDLELAADLQEQIKRLRLELGQDRFIWIAASTHDGEEAVILEAHKLLCEQQPGALLMLVPRHPDRFNTVARMCEAVFKTQRRSAGHACATDTAVYLGDTMGELMVLYGVSDVVFVGGSLIPRGGHNILEPAALAKPILTGPHVFNFADINAIFMREQAIIKVNDANSLFTELKIMMTDDAVRADTGARAKRIVEKNRGALAAQLALIKKWIVL